MSETPEVQLARLDERMKSIGETLQSIVGEMKDAAAARKRVYEVQERTEKEIIGINHRLDMVERSVEAIGPTTDELERVRDRVMFAGRLGKVLWSVGKVLLAAAAGASAAWYSMTGRPPP